LVRSKLIFIQNISDIRPLAEYFRDEEGQDGE